MADLNEALGEEGAGEGAAGAADAGSGNKVEQRINKMTATIKSKEEENARLSIENLAFKDPRFKRASEFSDEILSKVKTGVPVQDAIAAVLVEKNAFGSATADAGNGEGAGSGSGSGSGAAAAAEHTERSAGAGGSADVRVADYQGKKDPKTMTQEERLTALNQAEADGDIVLTN